MLLARPEVNMPDEKLTPEEARVIVQKGTELPFSGKYHAFKEKGTYVCKRCGAPLYLSTAKFDSGCGWPSFDEEIPGAVKRQPDADGLRTEITCAACGAHLGHVFLGEGFTATNTRHCVNSISMNFIPADAKKTETAVFASGCFWGTQYYLQQAKGVLTTTVGFTGGHTANPTYEEVCQRHDRSRRSGAGGVSTRPSFPTRNWPSFSSRPTISPRSTARGPTSARNTARKFSTRTKASG